MPDWSAREIFFAATWLLAVCLLPMIWRSRDPLVMRLILSFVAFLPAIGPLVVIWVSFTPPPQPLEHRDQNRYDSDVYARWIHRIRDHQAAQRERGKD